MKLRTGKPVWLDLGMEPLGERSLHRNIVCDVAIIGAGITGALVAHRLLNSGLEITVLDKRAAGFGSTAASTGLLLYQPDTAIGELSRFHSRKIARRVYALGQQAIREIGALSRELGVECGWAPRRTLYAATDAGGASFLRTEVKRTRNIGFPAELLSRQTIAERYGLDFNNALLSSGAAQVDPFALTRGVLGACRRNPRFQLFQHTRVTSLREGPDQIELKIVGGAHVRARHVIVAAGYEARQFHSSKLVRLHSTYVIASKPFPPARLEPLRCLMWETARPYFYLRTTPDHRIVFGGADEPFENPSRRDRKLPAKTRHLEKRFADLLPSLAFTADYTWAGTFAETTDGLPCIGAATPGSRVLYALGYGGNGITFSQIAARILRDACERVPNRDAKLFAFDRLSTQ